MMLACDRAGDLERPQQWSAVLGDFVAASTTRAARFLPDLLCRCLRRQRPSRRCGGGARRDQGADSRRSAISVRQPSRPSCRDPVFQADSTRPRSFSRVSMGNRARPVRLSRSGSRSASRSRRPRFSRGGWMRSDGGPARRSVPGAAGRCADCRGTTRAGRRGGGRYRRYRGTRGQGARRGGSSFRARTCGDGIWRCQCRFRAAEGSQWLCRARSSAGCCALPPRTSRGALAPLRLRWTLRARLEMNWKRSVSAGKRHRSGAPALARSEGPCRPASGRPAHPAGDRGTAARRRRPDELRDCRAALHQPEGRRAPHQPDIRQTRHDQAGRKLPRTRFDT